MNVHRRPTPALVAPAVVIVAGLLAAPFLARSQNVSPVTSLGPPRNTPNSPPPPLDMDPLMEGYGREPGEEPRETAAASYGGMGRYCRSR